MQEKIKLMGDQSTIEKVQPVSGGDINQAYYVQTANHQYFVKTNQDVPADFFQIEADGLDRIRNTETIAVPAVYHVDHDAADQEMTLIMEWIDGRPTKQTGNWLGEQLAAMHTTDVGTQYGLDQRTYVGALTQNNHWYDNWVDYYRDKRLRPQMDLAITNGRMTGIRQARLEQLLVNLERFIPAKPRVSLLHGDLWGGNWLTGAHGQPYLIDPSVLYGDHLFEIAFTELFSGFPAHFYQSYQTSFPLEDYYEDVKPLYQLFYLLVHLNLFGEAYGSSVDRLLAHYSV
ncbi:fructosamine kinase family protein [Gracilibacillus caseinilyticus]|uniref:Fructosamine kinase family protein n=1 Tax=Gracilibacillus caseinilyticus TaxID=2932256 RepID=A0ABY4F0K3_9BACI|nr:fructosamine kinase family protein [Gracilibacillus caseinilyticus]UOQ50199.1 fructosamine kinase family protein [Gracilibacillus caseinilyticus]